MEIKLRKQPHIQQQEFINCAIREQLYGGAKRGGKSVALSQKAILLSVLFPGNRGLLARFNFTDLYDTTINEFFQVCPPELISDHNKGERRITLRTICPHQTSDILYRGLGDPEDFEKVKSLTLGWLGIDEPTEVPLETYLMLMAQLTWQLPGCAKCKIPEGRPPYMGMLASNPEAGWVEDRFADLIETASGMTGRSIVVDEGGSKAYIPALPADNPFLPGDYVANLVANFPLEWVNKYVHGKWTSGEGAIFKELMPEVHDLDNWLPPASAEDQTAWWDWTWGLELYGGLDHASTGITAYGVMGTDPWANKFVLHEYYESNKLVSQHADQIKGLRERYLNGPSGMRKEFKYELIDPSTFQKNQQGSQSGAEGQQTVGKGGLQSIADIYREQGLFFIPAWNALELGLERMKEFMHPVPSHIHPFTGQSNAPALFISRSRCPNIWKDIRGLKKKLTSNGAVKIMGRDHGCDIVRYWLNSCPRRAEMAILDAQRVGSAEAAAVRAHQQWEKDWARQANGGDGTWFAGTGMTNSGRRIRPYAR